MIRSLGYLAFGAHALLGRVSHTSRGDWVVSPWNRNAERRQTTPLGTRRGLGEAMVLAHLGIRPSVETPGDSVDQPASVEAVEVVGRDVRPGQVTGTERPVFAEQFQGGFHLARVRSQ